MLPVINEAKTMSSNEIAELTCKEHGHVMRDIRNVLIEVGIDESKFGGIYTDLMNREKPCFNLPRRECDLVIAGYSAKYRLAIIDRWQSLEVQQQPLALPSYQEALRQLAHTIPRIYEYARRKKAHGSRGRIRLHYL